MRREERSTSNRPGKTEYTFREMFRAARRLYTVAVIYYRRTRFEEGLIRQGIEPRFRVSWKKLSALASQPATVQSLQSIRRMKRCVVECDSEEAVRVFRHCATQAPHNPSANAA